MARLRELRLTLWRTPVALAALLAAGVALRAVAMASYRPAALVHFDSLAYLDAAHTGLFEDPIHPAGYALFLRVAGVVDRLEAAIAVQHLLGVATALFAYAAVRRAGAPLWAALVPAAVVLLAGDQIFLEHAVMSEALFGALVAAAAWALVRGGGSLGWIAVSGALVGAAGVVRSVGLALVPVLALALLAAGPRSGLRRALQPAAFALPVLAVLGVYLAGQAAVSDRSSLTDVGGWATYGRAAPFADCDEFDPPAGTEPLCEDTPPDERHGGDWYAWIGGPARATFGPPPAANERVGAFGRAAIRAQPLDYVEAVAIDLARYVDPDAGPDREYGGDRPENVAFHKREAGAERRGAGLVRRFYGGASYERSEAVDVLADYGRVVRPHGILLALLLALGVAGAVAGRGERRRAAALLALVGATLLVAPAAGGFYNARYAVPAAGPIAAAGALGTALIAARLRGGDSRSRS